MSTHPLLIQNIIDNPSDIKHVKHLFEHAFPKEERPPFKILYDNHNHTIYTVSNEKEFVGFYDLIIFKDLLYIFFLAIKKKYRGQGYGSKIINHLLQRYKNKKIFLLAEEDGDEYSDNQIRIKRLNFYSKNGLQKSNIIIDEFGVKYILLSNKPTSSDEFLKIMRYYIGDELYHSFYLKNVRIKNGNRS